MIIILRNYFIHQAKVAFMISYNNVFFVLVKGSLAHDVKLYILNTVQYPFVNDHSYNVFCLRKRLPGP